MLNSAKVQRKINVSKLHDPILWTGDQTYTVYAGFSRMHVIGERLTYFAIFFAQWYLEHFHT